MCNNKYLVEYFLGCFGYNLDFDAPLVYAALQRTDRELKRRLSKADIPTLYSVFEANNFTYI